jgi:peroxiredoxin
MKTIFAVLTTLSILPFLFTQCRDARVSKGDDAPDFSAKNMDGEQVKLSDYRGKIVLVHFWASCCTDFTSAFPQLERTYRKLHSNDFELLAVYCGEPVNLVKFAAQVHGISFPLLMDKHWEIAKRYIIPSIPINFIVSKDGKIIDKVLGWPSEEYLRNIIGRLDSGRSDQ